MMRTWSCYRKWIIGILELSADNDRQYCPPEEGEVAKGDGAPEPVETAAESTENTAETETESDSKLPQLPDAPTAEPKAQDEPDAKKTKTTHEQ